MASRRLVIAFVAVVALLPLPARAQPAIPAACTFPPFISPGSYVEKSCLAVSPLIGDATVWTFVQQESITVFDANNNRVPRGTPDWNTFVGFFSLSVDTQRIVTSGNPADGEGNDTDVAPLVREVRPFRLVCAPRPLTALTGGEDPSSLDQNGCRIGRTRRVGTPYFLREYIVRLHMADEGNQTRYANWGIQFNEIRRFLLPAVTDCGYWTCDPSFVPGTYER